MRDELKFTVSNCYAVSYLAVRKKPATEVEVEQASVASCSGNREM